MSEDEEPATNAELGIWGLLLGVLVIYWILKALLEDADRSKG